MYRIHLFRRRPRMELICTIIKYPSDVFKYKPALAAEPGRYFISVMNVKTAERFKGQ